MSVAESLYSSEKLAKLYPSRIDGEINAEEIAVGRGVVVQEGVVITAKKVVLGDFCFIGENTKIIVPEFKIGDYTKLHNYSFLHGELPMQIGRNCWIGGNVVLDSNAGLDIDDNVGIGASSQLWTHIQFGDVVEGSRFYSLKYMHINKDVWFVGHCIVSPVVVGERSMALVGSVVTKDMEPNHIYAGVPARDISDKMGYQFEERTIAQKAEKLKEFISMFVIKHPEYADRLVVAENLSDVGNSAGITYFDVSTREYYNKYNPAAVTFLKENVPLVKFFPHGEPQFVIPQQADS